MAINIDNFDILGVRINNLPKQEIIKKIKNFLSGAEFHQIATVNPEFILLAQKDEEFKKILNKCDLNIADGFGIKLASWRSGKNLKTRVAGIDLMREILKMANQNKYSVFLAANKNGLSGWQETRAAILKIYPNLEINGADLSSQFVIPAQAGIQDRTAKSYANNLDFRFRGNDMKDASKCHILFCNFGAPHQEKFINSMKNGNIKLATGVGGSFDFITGKIKRAPLWIRNIGMEWFWRLILQPKRFKRIFNSVIVFLWKVMFKKKMILLNNKNNRQKT